LSSEKLILEPGTWLPSNRSGVILNTCGARGGSRPGQRLSCKHACTPGKHYKPLTRALRTCLLAP
jgi:hypothetical protein